MSDGPGRLFGVLCVMAGVWVGTYWLWEPSKPRTTVDQAGPVRIDGLDSIPITPPPVAPLRTPAGEGFERAGSNGNGSNPVRMVKRVEPPEYRSYVVQQGDTWARISQRFFGDSSKAELLTRHNPLVSPDLLRPGITIQIPTDPTNIQGRIVEVPVQVAGPTGTDGDSAGVQPVVPEASTPKHRTHVIQRDDTLWNLAKRYYGKGNLWRVIADANADRIPDPHQPPVGVEIVIPDLP